MDIVLLKKEGENMNGYYGKRMILNDNTGENDTKVLYCTGGCALICSKYAAIKCNCTNDSPLNKGSGYAANYPEVGAASRSPTYA